MRRVMPLQMLATLGLALLMTGCSSQSPFPYSGIDSARQLRPYSDESGRVPFRYATPVDWRQYHSLMLEPVVIYNGADNQFSDIEPRERQALANFMTAEFSEKLGQHFRFASAPTAATLRIRVTLTGAETTTPVLATFSRFDIGMGSYNLVQAARDRKGTFTGSVSYAVEIYDASSSRLLESYVAQQYPKTLDISSTFGPLSAARAGISRGAEDLVSRISAP